jgi:hypothetical protein
MNKPRPTEAYTLVEFFTDLGRYSPKQIIELIMEEKAIKTQKEGAKKLGICEATFNQFMNSKHKQLKKFVDLAK